MAKTEKKLSRDEIDELIDSTQRLYFLFRQKNDSPELCYTRLSRYVAARSHRKQFLKAGSVDGKKQLHYTHTIYIGNKQDPLNLSERFRSKSLDGIRILKKKQKGNLHDTLEDTGLTVYDLHKMGFDDDVIDDIYDLSKTPGEPYLDFLVRVGQASDDVIDIKIDDMEHNSREDRLPYTIGEDRKKYLTEKYMTKLEAYRIGIAYLKAIRNYKKNLEGFKIPPGTSISEFISMPGGYLSQISRENLQWTYKTLFYRSTESARMGIFYKTLEDMNILFAPSKNKVFWPIPEAPAA